MTEAKDETGWAALRASGASDKLKLVILNSTKKADAHVSAMTLAADWLASAIALRGHDECREFVRALEPAFATCVDNLSLFPRVRPRSWALDVLSFAAVAETLGITLDLLDIDVDAHLEEILASKREAIDTPEKVTAAFMSLARGKKDVRKAFPRQEVYVGPLALVQLAAAAPKSPSGNELIGETFEQILEAFPSRLMAKEVEWRTLPLAARVALSNFGTVAVGDVAATLAERIRALASS